MVFDFGRKVQATTVLYPRRIMRNQEIARRKKKSVKECRCTVILSQKEIVLGGQSFSFLLASYHHYASCNAVWILCLLNYKAFNKNFIESQDYAYSLERYFSLLFDMVNFFLMQ